MNDIQYLRESMNNSLDLLEKLENKKNEISLDFSMFMESVNKGDKDEIKSIVTLLYPKFKKEFNTVDYYFLRYDRYLEQVLRVFFGGIPYIPGSNIAMAIISALRAKKDKDFNFNWQIIGLVTTAKNIDEVKENLIEEYGKILGDDYTLKSKETVQMIDEFIISFLSGKYKKGAKTYFLYVDKK